MRARRRLEAIQRNVRGPQEELAEQRSSEAVPVRPPAAMTPIQYEAELAELAAQLESIRNSESYRVGHALVRAVHWPLRLARRRSPGRAPIRPRRRFPRTSVSPAGTGTGPFPAPADRPAVGPLPERARTTMFVLWGMSREELIAVVEEVATLQAMLRDFRPVFVTDGDSWSAFREKGYWFEHVVSSEEWDRHDGPGEWSDYVSERMASISATYAPDAVVVCHGGVGEQLLRRGALNGIVGRPVGPVEELTVVKGHRTK